MAERPKEEGSVSARELAEAIHAALVADDPDAYIDEFDAADRLVIDGRFDLIAVANALLVVVRKEPR